MIKKDRSIVDAMKGRKATLLKNFGSPTIPITVGIITGAVLGGILGGIANFSIGWGLVIGGALGGLVGGVKKDTTGQTNDEPGEHRASIKLREEQLDIRKTRVPTGKVNLRTEVVTEEKNIVVPVTRQDLVIEKTALNTDTPDPAEPVTEILRIPIREERVEISKHPVTLEDVKVYQRRYETAESVTENVRKEKLHFETTGNFKIIDKEVESTDKTE